MGIGCSLDITSTTRDRPIRIERVDVPVWLEKRPAGLLRDLAERKRMTVWSFYCIRMTALGRIRRRS
jgi:hypothetical protein